MDAIRFFAVSVLQPKFFYEKIHFPLALMKLKTSRHNWPTKYVRFSC